MRFRFNKSLREVISGSGVNSDALAYCMGDARKLMHEFVPMDTGRLADSVQESIEGNRGVITYNTPYARYCYYGEALNFGREKNPKAGAFWDRAMMQVYQGELYSRVEKYIKKQGK